MKRNIINEVSRMRQIMGLDLVLEQTDNIERIFISLLNEKSKIYWESAGDDFSCSPRYYFKYRFPVSELESEKLPEKTTTRRGVDGQYLYSSYNYIPKSYFKDESQYLNSVKELRNIEDQNGDRLGQVKFGFPLGEDSLNPDFNESSLNACKTGSKGVKGKDKREAMKAYRQKRKQERKKK